MLKKITPVILTFNEEPNIQRTLECLTWAKDIVVVDSFSTDDTVKIVRRFPRVRIFKRKFDSHSEQWTFAVNGTNIQTEWVLALDADYQVTKQVQVELRMLPTFQTYQAYQASFLYAIGGKILRGAMYPPVTVLYQRSKAHYVQDGHTQKIYIDGRVGKLKNALIHDDRKSFASWWQAQHKYANLEAVVLIKKKWSNVNWPDRTRKLLILSPPLALLYCWVVKKGIMDGRAGLIYGGQRFLAESLLAWKLLKYILCNLNKL